MFDQILFSWVQTVNDVITGIIFLGTRLHMQEISNKSTKSHSTALVLLNTRIMSGYKSIEEMLKPNSKVQWGNQFAFLHVPMPELKDHKSPNPLDFVLAASKIIKKKKSSLGVYLTGRVLEIVKKLRGPEVYSWSYSSPIIHYFYLQSFDNFQNKYVGFFFSFSLSLSLSFLLFLPSIIW